MNIIKKGSLVVIKNGIKNYVRTIYNNRFVKFYEPVTMGGLSDNEVVFLLEEGYQNTRAEWEKLTPTQRTATKILHKNQIGFILLYDTDEIVK